MDLPLLLSFILAILTVSSTAAPVESSDLVARLLSPCADGTHYVNPDKICIPCSRGTVLCNAKGYAISCSPGYFGANRSPCMPCLRGTFGPGGFVTGSNNACTSASAGYFVPLPASRTQTLCPAGKFSLAKASVCLTCTDAGFPGMFSLATTFQDCVKCGPGSSLGLDLSTCVSCLAGTYSPTFGSTCLPAPAGNFVPKAGATSFQPCYNGEFTTSVGSSQCSSCASTGSIGFISVSTTSRNCVPCPDGKYSDADGAYCFQCPSGTFSKGGTGCKYAPNGFFVANNGASAATPCPPRTLSLHPGATSCQTCAQNGQPGFLFASSTTPCTPCLNGNSSPDTISCRSCNAGFYSNGGAICTLVPAGSFSGPGASQPTPCPRNTYQNFAGATRCLGCSLTDLSIMYAPVGSTSCGNSYPVELTIHHLEVGVYHYPISSIYNFNSQMSLNSFLNNIGEVKSGNLLVSFYNQDGERFIASQSTLICINYTYTGFALNFFVDLDAPLARGLPPTFQHGAVKSIYVESGTVFAFNSPSTPLCNQGKP